MTLPPCRLGQVDQVGQVRGAQHRRLVDREEGPRADGHGAPGPAPAGQVAEETGAVVGLDPARGQGVARRLGRGDADDRAEARLPPRPGDLGQDPGLARPGRGVDHRHAPSVGQHRQRGRGLVLAQPGTGAPRLRRFPRPAPRRARARAGRGPRRARPRRPRGSSAARSAPAPARPWPPPCSAARAWRTGCRRGAGRRCGRPRGSGRAAGRPGRGPPGTAPARTPSAGSGPRSPPAASPRPPGPGRCGAAPGPGA